MVEMVPGGRWCTYVLGWGLFLVGFWFPGQFCRSKCEDTLRKSSVSGRILRML